MDSIQDHSSRNIQVCCRFRPLNTKEKELSESLCVSFFPDSQNLKIIPQYEYNEPLSFSFDHVFEISSKQEEVYKIAAKPIIESVMQGFNGTVFAYGQTSSGKTFTMSGSENFDSEQCGIIPRSIFDIFDQISASPSHFEYLIKVSYYEIYMEKIKDLLNVSNENLKIHEDKTRGIFISELTEKCVSNSSEILEVFKFGTENRNTGSTNMNSESSRSHSVFLITVNTRNNKDYISRSGKLHLVDLAGSEKIGKTNTSGKRLSEAKNINKSLTILGLVIYSLSDSKSSHIPYRDSKLTRVLQDSLGGNSKTSLVITCSPSPFNESETISTLRFGSRAKLIKNCPKINREYSVAELKAMLVSYQEEIQMKNEKIKSLEENLHNLGDFSPEKIEEKNEESNEKFENVLKDTVYDELISELEDTKNKLEDEVKISAKMKYDLQVFDEEICHVKAKNEIFEKKVNFLQERVKDQEKSLIEKSNSIEKLVLTKEELEKELQNATTKIIELEAKLIEKDLKKCENIDIEKKSTVEELKDLLKKEQENNSKAQLEITKLTKTVNELLSKNYSEVEITELTKEKILNQEREKWKEEKVKLIKDVQIRFNRVIELELSLEDANQNYKNLESIMSEGERALKKKMDVMQRNLEQLTLMYHQLITQKSTIFVEKQLAEKKLLRVNEKISELDEEIVKYKEISEKTQEKLKVCEEELKKMQDLREKEFKKFNIVKPVKGGTSHIRVSSVNPGILA